MYKNAEKKKKKAPPPAPPNIPKHQQPQGNKKAALPAMPRKAPAASRIQNTMGLHRPYHAPPPELATEALEKEEGPRLPVGMVLEENLTKAQKKNLKRKLGKQGAARAENSSEAGTAVTDGSTDHTSGFAEADWGFGEGSGGGHGQIAPHEIMGCPKLVSNLDRYKQLLGLHAYIGSEDEDEEGGEGYDSDSDYEREEQQVGHSTRDRSSGHIQNGTVANSSATKAAVTAAVAAGGGHLHVTAPQPSAAGATAIGALSSDGSSYEAFPAGWEGGQNGAHESAAAAAAKEEEMVALAMQLSLQEEAVRQQHQLQQQHLAAAPAPAAGIASSLAVPMMSGGPAASMGLPLMMPVSAAPVPNNTAGFMMFTSQAMQVPMPMPVLAPAAGGGAAAAVFGVPAASAGMQGLFAPQQQLNGVLPGGVFQDRAQSYATAGAAAAAGGAQQLLQNLGFGAGNGHTPPTFFVPGQAPGSFVPAGVLGGTGGFGSVFSASPAVTALGAGVAPVMATGHGLAEVNMGAGGQQLRVEDVEEDDEDDDEDELQELLGLCGVTAA